MTKSNPRTDNPIEYEQGRRARLSSVNKQESPYDAGSKTLAAWEAGYADAEGEAARNETTMPDTPKAGGDQLHAVASANKAKAS